MLFRTSNLGAWNCYQVEGDQIWDSAWFMVSHSAIPKFVLYLFSSSILNLYFLLYLYQIFENFSFRGNLSPSLKETISLKLYPFPKCRWMSLDHWNGRNKPLNSSIGDAWKIRKRAFHLDLAKGCAKMQAGQLFQMFFWPQRAKLCQ